MCMFAGMARNGGWDGGGLVERQKPEHLWFLFSVICLP